MEKMQSVLKKVMPEIQDEVKKVIDQAKTNN